MKACVAEGDATNQTAALIMSRQRPRNAASPYLSMFALLVTTAGCQPTGREGSD